MIDLANGNSPPLPFHSPPRQRQIIRVDQRRTLGIAQHGLDRRRLEPLDPFGVGGVVAGQAPGQLTAGLVAHQGPAALDGDFPPVFRLVLQFSGPLSLVDRQIIGVMKFPGVEMPRGP